MSPSVFLSRRQIRDPLRLYASHNSLGGSFFRESSITTPNSCFCNTRLSTSTVIPTSRRNDFESKRSGKGFASSNNPSSLSSSTSVFASDGSTSGSSPSTLPNFKSAFEESLQRLFQVSTLRVDLAPIKRPLMEGSVWFDNGKTKVSLISGICGNSREDVETRLRERAELLSLEFNKGFKEPCTKAEREAQAVSKRIQSAVGQVLPQLLNHLDIQLHIKFSFDKDQFVRLERDARRIVKEEETLHHHHYHSNSSKSTFSSAVSQEFKKSTANTDEDHNRNVPRTLIPQCSSIRCVIYMREVWETKMQWVTMASVTQDDVKKIPLSSFAPGFEGNTLLQALQHAANKVENVLLRKREDHYFESIREAELLLKEVSHCPYYASCTSAMPTTALSSCAPVSLPGVATIASVLRFLEPVELKSSVLHSSRGTPLMLKVALTDEVGNLSACALPLSGGCYALIRNKLHLSINFQYSCIQENGDIEEMPLEQLENVVPFHNTSPKGNEHLPSVSATPSSSSSLNVQSSMLPPPQRALRLLSTLLPTLWYHLSNLSNQDDLHERALLSSCPYKELKSGFTSAMIVHAGTVLHDEWWSEYNAVREVHYPPINYVALCISNKKTLEKYEEKLSTILGWREAPILHVVRNASLICFAVCDSKKRVLSLGRVFDSVEHFCAAVGGEEMVTSRQLGDRDYVRRQKSSSPLLPTSTGKTERDDGNEDLLFDSLTSSSSFSGLSASPPCQLDIIAVEETLRALGVVAGSFDSKTSTLELTKEKTKDNNGNGGVSKTLVFTQLNEVSGITRLFRCCQKANPSQTIYQTVRMDNAGATYCRRLQRLLALVFRKDQLHKPGLRGKWLPIPVPFTTKFLVLSFSSALQREMFSMTLLTAMEPFCRIPSDYPSFLWPACRLPSPCFFNFWGPTKKLLHRLGANYHCFLETTSADQLATLKPSDPSNDKSSTRNGKSVNDEELLKEKGNRNKEDPIFSLLIFCGNSAQNEVTHRIPLHGCHHSSELPITVLVELDRLVCEQSRSAHAKKNQFERLQKMLCDRAIPREVTLSSLFYWPKVLRLLYDSEEYYVRHQNQYKLLLELTPSLKTAELAVIDVYSATDEEWKNALATKYAEERLLPLLEPVSSLYTRGLHLLEKLPSPPPPNNATGKQLKFFSINIRADLKQNNFHGSLSAGSASFRKDTIQGLPSATPTAALESLLDEISETDEKELVELGQQVYQEITSGVPDSEGSPLTTLAKNSKLICSLELSAAQGTLSPYLSDIQTLVRLKRDLKAITHEYHWECEKLVIVGETAIPGEPPLELASKICTWDEIPIILPQLYTMLTRKEAGKYRKTAAELERAMTKGAVAMLEYDVRTRIVPVMGTEKLFQNLRVVQIVGENLWYAELRLPAGLLKIQSVGEPKLQGSSAEVDRTVAKTPKAHSCTPIQKSPAGGSSFPTCSPSQSNAGARSSASSRNDEDTSENQRARTNKDAFYVCCSTNTKRGALRKILSEFYRLYVACVDTKISLFGGQAPSSTAVGTAVVEKKPALGKEDKKTPPQRDGGVKSSVTSSSNCTTRPKMTPSFMRLPTSITSRSPSLQPDASKNHSKSMPSTGGTVAPPSTAPRQVSSLRKRESSSNTPSFTSHGAHVRTTNENEVPHTTDPLLPTRKVSQQKQSPSSGSDPASSSSSSLTPRKITRRREESSPSPGYSATFTPTTSSPLLPRYVGGRQSDKATSSSRNNSAFASSPPASSTVRSSSQNGNVIMPRKVKRVKVTTSSTSTSTLPSSSQLPSTESGPQHQHTREQKSCATPSTSSALPPSSLVMAILNELEKTLSSSFQTPCICAIRFSHSLGMRLIRHAFKRSDSLSSSHGGLDGQPSECLISQSLWSPTTLWQPFQLLQFLLRSLCQESATWSSSKDLPARWALLQGLCHSVRHPNTVLEPSMPAKHFCVFFFHRYFGWPACGVEDVPHVLASTTTGVRSTTQQSTLVFAESERKDSRSWMGTIKLVQCHPGTTEFVYCEVLATSSLVGDSESAVSEAWENCMVKIIASFGFDQQTNIYQYASLDKSVVRPFQSL